MENRRDEYMVHLLVLWKSWAAERSWYLSNFLPRVIEDPVGAAQNKEDRALLSKLHDILDDEEWAALGNLLAQAYRQFEPRILAIREERARSRRMGLTTWASDFEKQWMEQERLKQAEADRARVAETKARRARDAEQKAARRKIEDRRAPVVARYRSKLTDNFLAARAWLNAYDTEKLIADDEATSIAEEHIRSWFRQRLPIQGQVPFEPNDEQLRAISNVDKHALVGARAGSGKTTTMVARVLFLIEGCGVDPATIMMLAFNKRAADDLKQELRRALAGDALPHVMTFHALAHRLVHPSENLLYDTSDTMRPLTKHIKDVVSDFLRNPGSQARVREVMLDYFREDWGRVVARGDHLSAAEQVTYRSHLQQESLKGDFVKSYGEKVIANVLFTYGIAGDDVGGPFYRYEHDVRWNDFNYKPDFSIYDGDKKLRVVIEYFGMVGETEYDEDIQKKREFWQGREEAFLEYFPRDIAKSGFEERLLNDLRAIGAPLRKLSEEEIWDRVRDRAILTLTEAVTGLISRSRQRGWKGADVRNEWSTYSGDGPDLDRFVELGAELLDSYTDSLSAHSKEDFSGLMWRAVETVGAGNTRFGRRGIYDGNLDELQYLVVDEFQDFSLMFFQLIRIILATAPAANLMVVGDDWQAINEFAGSTTGYFESFTADFAPAQRLALSTNRRSTSDVVSLGNGVMAGHGTPAGSLPGRSGEIREFSMEDFSPTALEVEDFGRYDHTTPALLRLIQDHRGQGRSVAVLSRVRRRKRSLLVDGQNKTFPDFDSYGAALRKILEIEDPQEALFSSTHGFKGDEADAVILLDVSGRTYPLIHPTWALFQVFGDTLRSIEEAELRLFYVAVSRPRTHLDVITISRIPSPFWTRARYASAVAPTSWSAVPEFRMLRGTQRVEVRVRNHGVDGFDESKEALRSSNFRWRSGSDRYWHTIRDRENFHPARLLSEAWALHPGIRIEVLRTVS